MFWGTLTTALMTWCPRFFRR